MISSLGERIRKQRKTKKLTLAQMAERCNISSSFLSQIERNQAAPSVTTLHAIADTLDVSAASFFTATDSGSDGGEEGTPVKRDSAKVVRSNQRKTLMYPGSDIRNELLTPDLQGDIQMMWIVIPPGTDANNEPFTHVGEECSVILQGSLEIWIGDERYSLGPGDSIYHSSEIPRRCKNIGDADVVLVVAKTPPFI
jgi:transcriptional regulator with XRE-family HTH domain